MESNEQTLNTIVDELKEIGLKKMAEELTRVHKTRSCGTNPEDR